MLVDMPLPCAVDPKASGINDNVRGSDLRWCKDRDRE